MDLKKKKDVMITAKLLKEYVGLVVERLPERRPERLRDGNMKGNIGYALDQYTGKHITALEVYPDPRVEGTWAARAQWFVEEDGERPVTQDFLIMGVKMGGSIDIDRQIEEVEFNEWPPRTK